MPILLPQILNYTPVTRTLFHLSFWTIFFFWQYLTYERIDINSSWILFLKDVVALLTMFYATAYIAIPKLLLKGKFFLCLVWMAVMYAWWAELSYFSALLTLEVLGPGERLKVYLDLARDGGLSGPFRFSMMAFYMFDFMFLISLPFGMKIMQVLVHIRNQKTALELSNVRLELAFLKLQINPHFLFNTLNNIQILVSDRDPRGPDSLVQLSDMMSYLLHISEKEKVLISDEFDFLTNYVAMERLRLDERVQVDMRLSTDSDQYQVAPLIIFPLIENAFKHGPKTSGKNAWIDIQVAVENNRLMMRISNAYTPTHKPHGYVGGIGLKNVQKRLALNYKGQYSLSIRGEEQKYEVSLQLDLAFKN